MSLQPRTPARIAGPHHTHGMAAPCPRCAVPTPVLGRAAGRGFIVTCRVCGASWPYRAH